MWSAIVSTPGLDSCRWLTYVAPALSAANASQSWRLIASASPVHRPMTSGCGNLPGCDPAIGQLSERVVKVVGIEDHGVLHQAVVADFRDAQDLDGDRSIGIIGVAITHAGQRRGEPP